MTQPPHAALPDTMKAVVTHEYGGSEQLKLEGVPLPKPGAGQVLVKVSAASLNPRDWLLMRGLYPFKKFAGPFPRKLGSDFSGTIAAVGANTTRFKPGDQVFGLQPARDLFGAFAEYYAVSETALSIRPETLSHADVAGLPIAALTSLQALRDQAKLRKGQHILINGASGGVGTYAIQIAKTMGAYVTAVCGPDNDELCTALGADQIINYHDESFEDKTNEYDLVYDVIGRSSPAQAAQCLKPTGCYISTIPRPAVALAVAKSRLKNLFMFGKAQKAFIIVVKPDAADLATLAAMMEKGSLKTVIDSRYALKDIRSAFDRSQTWRTRGKIIIDIES